MWHKLIYEENHIIPAGKLNKIYESHTTRGPQIAYTRICCRLCDIMHNFTQC
jgi:hypothetical protein